MEAESSDTYAIGVVKKADSIVTVLKNYVKNGGKGFRITDDSSIYELIKIKISDIWRFTKMVTVVRSSIIIIAAQIEFEA